MFSVFRKKTESEPAAAAPTPPAEPLHEVHALHAPGTEIRFHPDLIQRFDGHHAALRKLFNAIQTEATRNDFAGAVASMQAFRRVLMTHLLEENVKLYTYLRKCLVNDTGSAELVRGMKTEMGEIGTRVMQFLNTYIASGITATTKSAFLADLATIGTALSDRLEREETALYTLYMPPDAFE
ncbi:MAG TPA: hemerythrin domain-containing protein [Rhodanobacteraceae bacterium]